MAATKAKKATREFWVTRDVGSSDVDVWPGSRAPKLSQEKCEYCTNPTCPENEQQWSKGRQEPVVNECASMFARTTGIRVAEGEAVLVRMVVVRRSK